jgi:hypothetical protein
MLSQSSKTKITPAKLYRNIGKYDSVFTIIFKSESELRKILGQHITATLCYSKDEREKFEKRDDAFIDKNSNGIIKINIVMPELNVNQKIKYTLDGINCSEIDRILYSPIPYESESSESSIKEVPNIIKIPYESKNKFDYENLFLGLYSRLINSDEILLYDEKVEYVGIDTAFHNGKTSSELLKKLNLTQQEIQKNSIFWISYYSTKEKISLLTLEEKKDYQNHKDIIWYKKLKTFFNEIIKSGKIADDKFFSEKSDLILKEINKFKTSRFGFGNPLIYWDLESYLHIILRHIRETKIGSANQHKTEIPYRLDDLKTLIQKLLDLINEELEEHFKTNLNIKFYRSGKRAIYFNKDYYSIDIDVDGKIISFYRN